MSDKTIYEVLKKGGFEKRPETVFVDNRDKHFKIIATEKTANVVVSRVVDNLRMSARYEFDLVGEKTNAASEEIVELKRWLEIRTFPVAAEANQ
jgi:hypothetical protein